MALIRINKFLAKSGVASRRKAEQFVLDGKVEVNGKIVRELGTKIDPEKDEVKMKGESIKMKDQSLLIMLNKPAGYVCTNRKFKNEKSVLDLIKTKERLYSVGRLDKNSEGLLLLTNDGDLALKLTHPRYEKEKEYEVTVDKDISIAQLKQLQLGVEIETGKTLPAKVKKINSKKFAIILKEGKKRQIRRMCEKVGLLVEKLLRTRINKLKLGNLASGKYIELNKNQRKSLE